MNRPFGEQVDFVENVDASVIVCSFLTDYELGVSPTIPMPVHFGIDVLGGILLTASPWLFGFADVVFWPYLVLGLVEIATALMTKTQPEHVRADIVDRR